MRGGCCYNGKTLAKLNIDGEGWIRHILEDKNGILWFGTRRKGVWSYDGKSFTNFKIGDAFIGKNTGIMAFTTTTADENDNGLAIMIDANGSIWFGGGEKNEIQNAGGIWRYDGKKFTNFETKNGLGDYAVFSFLQDKQGNIWVGTRNTGLYRYDGKAFAPFSE